MYFSRILSLIKLAKITKKYQPFPTDLSFSVDFVLFVRILSLTKPVK